ncbi:hypothetical protein MUA02_07100 [Enterobacteriaceae bacterium H20N1]|uniref:Uncharacterized protein n=1 Tax=Dryocola boscaweniae TaxID=2925397 RepID=A0A9X3AC98_9ENTR|nr:hypothetical protein [Dryocola boscaweniae]MCT4701643.1 hypothetical protein [Dryocola boscaweniae]MCT4716287.1 hypothetical protein [Dryocola boscaweniae]MCT4718812.1 hypothetical protein [Dryocola boscaweniae]
MNSKKIEKPYTKPSHAQIERSVVTSTAIETGQTSNEVEGMLKKQRKKFSHLHLAL